MMGIGFGAQDDAWIVFPDTIEVAELNFLPPDDQQLHKAASLRKIFNLALAIQIV